MTSIAKPPVRHPALPKNALGRQMRRKLRVYAGSEHPHQGQSPEPLTF